ncbi:MAG: 5-(carboxyamino)imidazole ribonucleotide synthase [Crocinitomicaceae bacterium]|nr:5-(carboxyamino)imidazole ribonucleotide synthase [Crocinitomicaceae bacterium]MBK8924516.1 5-(carboxyamino)imidazole ribonucleotide synthase [Crocinitomicaceae bacterium]
MLKKKIGIVGGGQLGRMLINESIRYDLEIAVLDPDVNAPCKSLAHTFHCGSLQDFDTVYAFGKTCDIITIEIENIHVDALEKLASEGIHVFPQPHIIRMIQDKGLQKEFYLKNSIPTAEFKLIRNHVELHQNTSYLPFVQKLRVGGYDGKGVEVMKTSADFVKGFDAPSVLEKFVDFKKEISVIVARNSVGQIKNFPVVELEFNPVANLVEFLFSPADISSAVEVQAQKIAVDIIEKLQLTGVLAVEMFVTHDDQVLVNEIAPRPHNSGHQTIEANITSQYEQHLRAILNLPLGATESVMPSVMVNLLGEINYSGQAAYEGLDEILQIPGVYLHLYGKKTTKPFRKMGHVTILDHDMVKAKEKAHVVKQTIRVISSGA